ncbi:MAG: zinc ribbon domain-containing protein [Phycisphaeraceae bacterium]
MPTYEYICKACQHEFEEFQSMSAKPLRKCPACGKLKLKRLIGTGAGVIFKGSGFWQTDYRSEGYKKAAEADSKAGKEASEPKSESKAESKSDAKTETKSDTAAKPEAKASESKPAKIEPAPKPEKKSKKPKD